jgi:hypothetical protein
MPVKLMKYVIMVLYMSEKLDCTCDYSQILNLFEKSELKESLSDNEVKQVNEYTLRLTYLESYANANNDKDIKEVAGFFSYFCNKYDSYSSLPGEVYLSFDVAYFSDPTAFMGKAYAASSCSDSFEVQ